MKSHHGPDGNQGGEGTAPTGGPHRQAPPQADPPQPRGCQDLSKAAVLLLHPHLHFTVDQDLLPDLQNLSEMKTGSRMWT